MLSADDYQKVTESCALNSEVFAEVSYQNVDIQGPYYVLTRRDALYSAFHFSKHKTAILNLMCTEASNDKLFTCSNLYEVLMSEATKEQEKVAKETERPIIYSPSVQFGGDGMIMTKDVISIVLPKECDNGLTQLLERVRDVTVSKKLDTLIVNVPSTSQYDPVKLCKSLHHAFRSGHLRRIVLCVKDDFAYGVVEDEKFTPCRKMEETYARRYARG